MRLAVGTSVALGWALAAGLVAAEVRVYRCQHRPVHEAAALAEPMLSPEGSLELQPRANTLLVRDHPDVIERVVSTLARWDVAPSAYRVRVRLVMASTGRQEGGGPRPTLSGFGAELTGLLNFSAFEEIDTVEVVARDGGEVESPAGRSYRLKMRLQSATGDPTRLQLAPFEVLRREGNDRGVDVMRRLLRGTVSLKSGQTGILMAASGEQAKRVLVVIVGAQQEPGQ